MKIGLLAYSTDTGLGNQTYEFYKNIRPDKVLVADLSRYNKVETHHERYYQPTVDDCSSPNYISNESCEWLVDGMDVVFVCETPLNYYLYEYAQRKGVKVIQQYNYEFLDFFDKSHLPKPSLLAAPTNWNIDIVKQLNFAKVQLWPVPVNRDLIKFREIKKCETFVHIIGRPAIHDRNGTIPFLKAAKILGNQFKYKIYLQLPSDNRAIEYFEPVRREIEEAQKVIDLEVIHNVVNYEDIYSSGDILVFPRRYGGLCLPMQEALSAGMPVIMTDISPNNNTLPPQWLVPAVIKDRFYAHTNIDVYEPDLKELVIKMQYFTYTGNMELNNKVASEIAENLSWDKMKVKYMEWMNDLVFN